MVKAIPLLFLVWATFLPAAEVPELSVSYERGEFLLEARMDLQAPAGAVYQVLSDYDHWTLLSKSVISSKLLSSADDRHRVHSRTRACVLFFCGYVDQVQEVSEKTGGEIVAVTVSRHSNLRQGVVRWQVSPDGERSRVALSAHLTPDFWIPPWIGPWAINAGLRRQVIETAENLEKLAHTRSSHRQRR